VIPAQSSLSPESQSAAGYDSSNPPPQGKVSAELPARFGLGGVEVIGLAAALGGALIALLRPFRLTRPLSLWRKRDGGSGDAGAANPGGAPRPPTTPPGAAADI
jgi:hypothetical protein